MPYNDDMCKPLVSMRSFVTACLLGAAASLSALAAMGAEPTALDYETHVRPLLEQHCFECHGKKARKGELSLATAAAVVEGGESGVVIEAGKPDESLLLEMIADGSMPPEDSGVDPLSKDQIAVIRRWIVDGAKFREKVARKRPVTQHDIVPLMLLRCTACHGGRRREADLDLRTKASMLKGGKSGPAVVAGKPQESLIVKRIEAGEMPPKRLLVSVSVKPMEEPELAKLKRWIEEGLPESSLGPDVATTEPDPLVTDEDRDFWSFKPPHAATPPIVTHQGRVRNAIDAFVLARLEARELSLSPEADRATLIRRVTFDLIGLPPTPEEVEAFVADSTPLAYERLVDRLLASPRHGERWARYWLDAAGYADSEGAQNEDRVRPHLWRFRDYVIRAFDRDKPYDRFLHEQIAGDELADYENAETITEEIYDNLAATGFLRTAPDRTFANITNFVPERLEVIADEIQIFSSAVLGLTINCARCHSHKFDPIPQRDYYRLAAVFKDALDEHDWIKSQGPRTLKFVPTDERVAWEAHEAAIDERVAPLKQQLKEKPDAEKKKELESRIKKIEAGRKPEPRIRALWSRGDPSPTHLLKRGNYLTAGREVGPGVLAALTDGKTPFEYSAPWKDAGKTGRRLALARWLTKPDNPLTARVMVNRLWKHHFGRGIVSTLDNFGATGARPSHPQLLDRLAVEFVRSGWSIKALHRLMLTSSVYRQQSRLTSELAEADPENSLFSRMPLRRMEAEVVRDSLLAVSGQLDPTPFGPPDGVEVRGDGLVTSKKTGGGWRRSIYVLQRRTQIPTLLDSFDFPQMGPNCLERTVSIVAPQALHLLNDAQVHQWSRRFADRVGAEVGEDRDAQIHRVHALAFGAAPTVAERSAALEMLDAVAKRWRGELGSTDDANREARRRALANYCHAVMNSAAFVYID